MKRSVTIAEARNDLPALVHEAERQPIELTRRGKPVAVLLSRSAYDRLRGAQSDAWAALEAFRSRHVLAELDLGAELEGTRDKAPGRAFRW